MLLGHWQYFHKLQRLLSEEDGQDLVEYALLIAMIVVTATASSRPVAEVITGTFNEIATAFTNAVA
jgi:Flp pilus assembly pilin Flp